MNKDTSKFIPSSSQIIMQNNKESPMKRFLPEFTNFGWTIEGHGHNPLACSLSEWNKTDWTRQSIHSYAYVNDIAISPGNERLSSSILNHTVHLTQSKAKRNRYHVQLTDLPGELESSSNLLTTVCRINRKSYVTTRTSCR